MTTTTTTFAASVDAERAKYVVIGGCRVTVGALDDFWSEQGERFSLRTIFALAVLDARLRRAGSELGEVFHVARDGEVSAPLDPYVTVAVELTDAEYARCLAAVLRHWFS